ncbi:FHA domain-containing protein [Mycobacterium sp. Marseille-P9652]|uniref:FHA domain-containing protein n=1 Tax=Mycobacterium sp. Marseille-P9652 TaxID=2654950 RepID=UPI0012E7F73D|nr:FHA domain-containing protein [Mycobacterium sp. Marseille-P9652]
MESTGGYRQPSLTIRVGAQTYTARDSDAPITIGREFPAQVRVADDRISRTHVRLDCTPNGWVAVDQSRNGIYLDGVRQSVIPIRDGTTIHLGNPQGIPVAFAFGAPERPEPAAGASDDDDSERTLDTVDAGIARAGAAVAARREELKLTQRYLARSGIVNAGALIDFEKGRRWPRKATLARLEDALQWPHGTIARLRREQPDAGNEDTVVMTNTVRAPLLAEAVEVALTTITTAIESLPEASDPEFGRRATGILADLRKLEGVAAGAARSAKGAPEVALVLSAVRRSYKDLMLRAARAPGATLGQRLYAARYRAELTAEELANAAGVPVEAIAAVEAEVPLDADTVAALTAALGSLTRR